MGKLVLLNVLLVFLAVYTAARYTYDNQDAEIEEEINEIARALDDVAERQAGYCDSVCSDDDICDCSDENCIPDDCFYQREFDVAEDQDAQEQRGYGKKLIRTRRNPVRSRRNPVDTRRNPVDTRRSPVNTRRSPVNTRRSPVNTRRNPFGK